MGLEDDAICLAKMLQQVLLVGSLVLVNGAEADGRCGATAVKTPLWWHWDQEGLNLSIDLGREIFCV